MVRGTRSEAAPPAGADTDRATAFARAAGERPPGLLRDFLGFLAHNRKWWLLPLLGVLLLAGVLVVLGGSALSPFLYAFW